MRRGQGKLTHPQVRYRVMRDVAEGMNGVAIAEKYGVARSYAYVFIKTNQAIITELKDKLNDEWAEFYIAKKKARIAEYQADLEDINERLISFMDMFEEAREIIRNPESTAEEVESAHKALDRDFDVAQLKHKATILRNVAEEVGDLRQNVDLTARLTYEVIGVSSDDLS